MARLNLSPKPFLCPANLPAFLQVQPLPNSLPPDTSHTLVGQEDYVSCDTFNNVIFSVAHLKCATIAQKHCAYSKTAVSNIWMCLCCWQYSKVYTHTKLDHTPATTELCCFLCMTPRIRSLRSPEFQCTAKRELCSLLRKQEQ